MTEISIAGDPPISVQVRRSARARRLTLRVSQLDGRVTLSAPPRTRARVLEAFVAERAGWIRQHLARQAAPLVLGPGASLPIEGRPHELVAGRVRAPRLEPGQITLPEGRPTGPGLKALVKALARDRLAPLAEGYARQLDRKMTAISLRDPRSRWGSCSGAGRLMFSWRLIMAPPEVAAYVAAHEAAHLVEMNHSPAFWALVEQICPDWRARRDWLHEHGASLHRYRFEA